MKYVYYIFEKNDETTSLDEEFIVYETFDKAVEIAKQLLQQEFVYIQDSYDEDLPLEVESLIKKEKEFFEGTVFNEEDIYYTIRVKRIPLIS